MRPPAHRHLIGAGFPFGCRQQKELLCVDEIYADRRHENGWTPKEMME